MAVLPRVAASAAAAKVFAVVIFLLPCWLITLFFVSAPGA
ncbi:hypothetical protein RSK20926_17747 [Roseobacter sp. SK209-2-6]|nr:hypothetical protein RSK20926_17747 [Roseobacter sp. SK209-2-6]